jgi:hypothetical protein
VRAPILVLALLLAGAAFAQEPEAETEEPAPSVVEPEAIEIVTRMADLLAKTQSVHWLVETSYDAVQPDGEKVEFGARRDVTVRRPHHARLDVVDRDGSERTIRYDGKLLSVVAEDDKVYATVERQGTLDQLVDYIHGDLGIPMPLSELFSPELPQMLTEEMSTARYVGPEVLLGKDVDHLVFRNDEVGVQLWIDREGAHVPRRVVIDYLSAVGQPQFRADFLAFELAVKAPDSLFAFTPPKGYEKIVFIPRKRSTAPPTTPAPAPEAAQ